jgi:pimeloyl-ACP methyl ester carboxylesterase
MLRMAGFAAAVSDSLRGLARDDAPPEIDPRAGRPILLLHGFGASSRVLLPLSRALGRALSRPVLRLRLGERLPLHTGDIRASAERADRALRALAARPGFGRADVVGHSLGGLVATYLLKRLDRGARVRRVVTLGAPHRGTPAALLGLPLLAPFSRALWQMLPGSTLVRELSALSLPEGCELVSVAGGADLVVPPRFAEIAAAPGQRNLRLPELDHWDLLGGAAAARVVACLLVPGPRRTGPRAVAAARASAYANSSRRWSFRNTPRGSRRRRVSTNRSNIG